LAMRSCFLSALKDCLKPIHTSTLNPNNKTNSLFSSTIHSEKSGITSRRSQVLQESSRHYRKLLDSLRSNRNNHQDITNNATTDAKIKI